MYVRKWKKKYGRKESIPISSGAGKHLVDANNVPWVDTHTHVERILGSHLCDVLVAGDTGSLESFRGDLLTLWVGKNTF